MTEPLTSLIERLKDNCIDYDGTPLHDDEFPRSTVTCRELREIIAALEAKAAECEERQKLLEELGAAFLKEQAELIRLSVQCDAAWAALEPFADAFEAARDKYIRRYRSNPTIGATNFDAMPDDWKMDTVMFTMGDFRRARTALQQRPKT